MTYRLPIAQDAEALSPDVLRKLAIIKRAGLSIYSRDRAFTVVTLPGDERLGAAINLENDDATIETVSKTTRERLKLMISQAVHRPFVCSCGHQFVMKDTSTVAWNDPTTGSWAMACENEAGSFRLPADVGLGASIREENGNVIVGDRYEFYYLGQPFIWGMRIRE